MAASTPASANLGPGGATTLFALPQSVWTSLNRRAALVSGGWVAEYGGYYPDAAYVPNSGLWRSRYFPLLATIAGQTLDLAQRLANLAAASPSQPAAGLASEVAALSASVQALQASVNSFCSFSATYLAQTQTADAYLSGAVQYELDWYDVTWPNFGVPISQVASAAKRFLNGWLGLAGQFQSAGQLARQAAAPGTPPLFGALDLAAAGVAWSKEIPQLQQFVGMAAGQGTNLDGDYLYTLLPPLAGTAEGNEYCVGFGPYWLQTAPTAPYDVSLAAAAPGQLPAAPGQTWRFEAIPGGFGSYYLINALVGDSQVMTCAWSQAAGNYVCSFVPKAALPANGWRFFNYGQPPAPAACGLANAGLNVSQQLQVVAVSGYPASLQAATPTVQNFIVAMGPQPTYYSVVQFLPVA